MTFPDDAYLDGCDLDFQADAVDDETAMLTAMFADVPVDQVDDLAEFYRAGWEDDA